MKKIKKNEEKMLHFRRKILYDFQGLPLSKSSTISMILFRNVSFPRKINNPFLGESVFFRRIVIIFIGRETKHTFYRRKPTKNHLRSADLTIIILFEYYNQTTTTHAQHTHTKQHTHKTTHTHTHTKQHTHTTQHTHTHNTTHTHTHNTTQPHPTTTPHNHNHTPEPQPQPHKHNHNPHNHNHNPTTTTPQPQPQPQPQRQHTTTTTTTTHHNHNNNNTPPQHTHTTTHHNTPHTTHNHTQPHTTESDNMLDTRDSMRPNELAKPIQAEAEAPPSGHVLDTMELERQALPSRS